MAVKKFIIGIFLSSFILSPVADARRDEPLEISKKWYYAKGCPKTGEFKVECNVCDCKKKHTQIAKCDIETCPHTEHIDDWDKGTSTCEPGKDFYSNCKKCKCDESGISATCDDRACSYYGWWENAKATAVGVITNGIWGTGTPLLEISQAYYKKNGCPKKGKFLLECKNCNCPGTGSKDALCSIHSCPHREFYDKWIPGTSECVPDSTFYCDCAVCKCDSSGKKAKCNKSACKYYRTHF